MIDYISTEYARSMGGEQQLDGQVTDPLYIEMSSPLKIDYYDSEDKDIRNQMLFAIEFSYPSEGWNVGDFFTNYLDGFPKNGVGFGRMDLFEGPVDIGENQIDVAITFKIPQSHSFTENYQTMHNFGSQGNFYDPETDNYYFNYSIVNNSTGHPTSAMQIRVKGENNLKILSTKIHIEYEGHKKTWSF